MKKILLAVVFGVATGAMAQSAAQPAASSAPTQPAAAPAQGAAAPSQAAAQSNAAPVIKDPAEYNAYVSAYSQKDPAAQISGLEAFLTQYPNSIMKGQALEILMSAYQQTNNPKVADAAQRLLAINPDNVKALVVLAFSERFAQKWADAKQHAEHALEVLPKWTKPDGVSDADFAKQKTSFAAIMESVAGFSALQLKDYPSAQKHLRAAVEADPNNVDNVFALATSLLPPSTPPDPVNGLFFIARAVNLAPAAAKDSIKNFGHNRYVRYHGGEDGWTDLLTQTATTQLPPAGFTIKPAPSPAEQAHLMVTQTPPDKMDFATWEFVLSNGAQEDQDAVWNAIKGKPVQMVGTVISTQPDTFMIAGSSDDIDAKKADLTLKFEEKVPVRMIPKDGSDNFQFQGEPASYTPNPFMMVMEKGKLLSQPKPSPAHKPAAKKPAAQ